MLEDIRQQAIDRLRDHLEIEELQQETSIDSLIHEIAEEYVPSQYDRLLAVVGSSYRGKPHYLTLHTYEEPQMFSSLDSAMFYAVFEFLRNELHDAFEAWKEERA